jgi:hypothetical protein
MDRQRYTCTSDAPWTPDKGAAEHPEANWVGERDYGDEVYDKYHCPACDLRFTVEVGR